MVISSRVLLVVAGLLVAPVALAAPCAPGDDACVHQAETQFQDARAAMSRGDYATACPLLERSYALDPGNGTLLALALCHEGQDKLATALAEYKEALAGAVKANRPDRVMLAESHVQALERRVPRLKIAAPSPEPPDLAVTVDGAVVARADMLSGVPVNPGPHEIVATTSGKPPFHTTIVVKLDAPSEVHVPSFESGKPPGGNGARTAAFVTGGFALAALGAGAVFGALTLDTLARSKSRCDGTVCSAEGVELNHEAKRDSVIADVLFVSGAVLGAATIVLGIVAAVVPRSKIAAAISVGHGGLAVSF